MKPISIQTSPPGAVPPEYKEVLYWKLTQSFGRMVVLNLLALLLIVVFGAGFILFMLLIGRPLEIRITRPIQEVCPLLFSPFLVLLLHEWVHGIAMQAFGAHPQYGFSWKGLMLYATAPGHAFQRNHYLVVALAPVVCLSLLAWLGIWLLAEPLAAWLLAFAAILNGAGACGDLWMSAIVLRYPAEAYVVDERDGMRIFLPDRKR